MLDLIAEVRCHALDNPELVRPTAQAPTPVEQMAAINESLARTAAENARDYYKDLWEQSCRAVAELCKEAGMPEGGAPDLWTLRECIQDLKRNRRESPKPEPDAWAKGDDKPIPEDARIKAMHPTRSGRHDEWAEAMRMVGAKFSKYGLVALVHWLLCERHDACEAAVEPNAELLKLRKVAEAARIFVKSRPGSNLDQRIALEKALAETDCAPAESDEKRGIIEPCGTTGNEAGTAPASATPQPSEATGCSASERSSGSCALAPSSCDPVAVRIVEALGGAWNGAASEEVHYRADVAKVEALLAEVRAEEREACARAVEGTPMPMWITTAQSVLREEAAKRIRNRPAKARTK